MNHPPNDPLPPGRFAPPATWGAPTPVPAVPKKNSKWPLLAGAAVVLVVGVIALASPDRVVSGTGQASATSSKSTSTTTRTTTSRRTTTTTPPPLPPSVFTGVGDDVIALDRPAGFKVVTFECPACTGNTVLKSDGFESLSVNEIGAYRGTRWMDIRDESRTSTLTVTATGSWTVTVDDFDALRTAEGPMSGTGDAVVFFTGSSRKARITNVGEGNFIVHAVELTESRLELLVNHIGGYEGTVPLSGPAVVQVTSGGDWTITPS